MTQIYIFENIYALILFAIYDWSIYFLGKLFRRKSTGSYDPESQSTENSCSSISQSDAGEHINELASSDKETPVVLTIPLRLGLSEILPSFFDRLKVSIL